MATSTELMLGRGIHAGLASMLGQDTNSGVSAAGTTQATATALKGGLNVVSTVASGAGVVLPAASAAPISAVVNGGANVLTVYPAVGETLNALSANSGVQIATGKSAIFVPSANRWAAIIGA